MRIQTLLLGTSLSLVVGVVGCMRGDSTSSVDSPETAADSADSVSAEGDVMVAAVDGADATSAVAITAEQAAARIAANAMVRWTPAGCATVTQSGTNVTIVYADCSGPRGLVHLTGTLALGVSVDLAGIHVTGNATGLEVNSATIDVNTNALYTSSAGAHTLTVDTTGSGTGPLGNAIDHTGDYTVTWNDGSQCRSIDGMWSTEITTPLASATRSNDLTLQRCAGGCPTGSLTHHYLAGASVTVTFDGTAIATWSGSGGRSGTIALACQ